MSKLISASYNTEKPFKFSIGELELILGKEEAKEFLCKLTIFLSDNEFNLQTVGLNKYYDIYIKHTGSDRFFIHGPTSKEAVTLDDIIRLKNLLWNRWAKHISV